MKYARIERERRFLMQGLPEDVDRADYQRIIDRYIPGTRLRLRRIESPTGETVALKLTQKYSPDTGNGTDTIITNLYLNEEEFDLLAGLDGLPLHKRRYSYHHDGRRYSIDVFEGVLTGLILCEIEAESAESLATIPLPPFALREVTDDLFYTGGHLITTTRDEIQASLNHLREG